MSEKTDEQWTIEQAQQAVDEWIGQWEQGYWPPLSNLARLTEEVGELAQVINERHGHKPPSSDRPSAARVADELGDVLFVVITLANSLDIDLDQSLRDVMEKYGIRDASRFTKK